MQAQADLPVMVNASLPARPMRLRSRAIVPADLDGVAALLHQGFGWRRSRGFWQRLVATLRHHPAPAGFPQFGYLLEAGDRPVGVLLLIFSMPKTGPHPAAIRCSMSSWYVEPAFRGYATLLAAQAMRHKEATYLNTSPAPNTMAIVRAQGYVKYSGGLFFAATAAQAGPPGATLVAADADPGAPHRDFERDLLRRHAAYGCVSFWGVGGGEARPFVFRRRFAKAVLPCAQLIYCRDTADVVRFAGPIGRHLLAHGCPLLAIDATGPVPGLAGRYFDGVMPKYYRGSDRPRLGDLAYTETAMFGI